MNRIFWIECPNCQGKFFCDYELRFASLDLQCPFCEHKFQVGDSSWIDERA